MSGTLWAEARVARRGDFLQSSGKLAARIGYPRYSIG